MSSVTQLKVLSTSNADRSSRHWIRDDNVRLVIDVIEGHTTVAAMLPLLRLQRRPSSIRTLSSKPPHRGVKKMWRFLALSAAVCTVLGCGSSTEPADRADGAYVLITINGHALPAPESPGSDLRVLASTLTLEKGGLFSRTLRDSLPPPLGPHVYESTTFGQWTIAGSSVTLATSSSNGLGGVLEGGTLTLNDPIRGSWRYQRK